MFLVFEESSLSKYALKTGQLSFWPGMESLAFGSSELTMMAAVIRLQWSCCDCSGCSGGCEGCLRLGQWHLMRRAVGLMVSESGS